MSPWERLVRCGVCAQGRERGPPARTVGQRGRVRARDRRSCSEHCIRGQFLACAGGAPAPTPAREGCLPPMRVWGTVVAAPPALSTRAPPPTEPPASSVTARCNCSRSAHCTEASSVCRGRPVGQRTRGGGARDGGRSLAPLAPAPAPFAGTPSRKPLRLNALKAFIASSEAPGVFWLLLGSLSCFSPARAAAADDDTDAPSPPLPPPRARARTRPTRTGAFAHSTVRAVRITAAAAAASHGVEGDLQGV